LSEPCFICLGFEILVRYQLKRDLHFLLRKRNEAKKIALYICKLLYPSLAKGRVSLRFILLIVMDKGAAIAGGVVRNRWFFMVG